MAIQIVVTNTGRAEIVNAENNGTAPVLITEVGFGGGKYTASPTQTALQSEFKRLGAISGQVVSDDTIHVSVEDQTIESYEVYEFGVYTDSGTLFAVYSQNTPITQKTANSFLLLAVDILFTSINAGSVTFGSVEFNNPPASETVKGVVYLATTEDARLGLDDKKALTSKTAAAAIEKAINEDSAGFGRTVTLRPLNISPGSLELDVVPSPVLTGYDYYALYSVPQLQREFQIDILGQQFVSPIYAATETPTGGQPAIEHLVGVELNIDTSYIWRYRDKTVAGDISAWSNPTQFKTANTYIEQPTITSPTNNQTDVGETPDITSSTFNVVNGTDTHQSTSWRIVSSGATVWESLLDATNLTSVKVPAGNLVENTTYEIQVKYHGAQIASSAWSPTITITTAENFAGDIGAAGSQGFGVGVYPGVLPSGFTALTGATDKASDNYGNYQYSDGSILAFIPAFYYRFGSTDSPNYATYGANAIDIVGLGVYADQIAAAADGYALHRAFIDGGAIKSGFFFDKYLNSKNGVLSGKSIKDGVPISLATTSGYTNSAGMTNCAGQLHDAITLSRARGAGFNCASAFQYSAIALISLAHGQASTASTFCAWYDGTGTTNYPKGCNSSLSDIDDSGVTFTTAGDTAAEKPLAGSGAPFAKTTHNGQPSGVADVNGSMYQVALGITSPGTSATSGSAISNGNSYVLKESVAIADLTNGFGGATDAWGTDANLAANYEQETGILPWGSATTSVYFGNGANQVFSPDTSGQGWLKTAIGIQDSNASMSAAGTNLFGQDLCQQRNVQNMFVLCGGNWSNGSGAGVFYRNWNNYRSNSGYSGGFRAAAYGL